MIRWAIGLCVVASAFVATRSARANCNDSITRSCAAMAQFSCVLQSEYPYDGGVDGYWNGVPLFNPLYDHSGGGFFNQELPPDWTLYGMPLSEYMEILNRHYQDPNEPIDDLLADAVRVCGNREMFEFGFQAYNACVAVSCEGCVASIPTLGGTSANCLWYQEDIRNHCTSFLSMDQCEAMYGTIWQPEPDVIPSPGPRYYETGGYSWSSGGGGGGYDGGWGDGGGYGGGGGGGGAWVLYCTTTDYYTCVSVGGVSYGCSYDYSETSCGYEYEAIY